MKETLDMQVAALIFLGGTKCLITSEFSGDDETTNENISDEEKDDSDPVTKEFITAFRISTTFPNIQNRGQFKSDLLLER